MTTAQIGKILVVDDEVELKNILVESLTSQGYETSGLTSGEKALAALRTEQFDVVLTDMMMPGMNGITLVQEGLQIDPHLVCIVMTGQGTIQTAVDSMKAGAFDYILKPFRLETLLSLITRAMNVRHMRLGTASLHAQDTLGIEDITERKRAETERQRLEEQLRHSQKMEAIGQLVRGVAHDFNNVLTAINGYSSLALQRGNPDSRTKTYLEEIRKAADRAANLTRQLLALGRKQMLNPEALNLNEVVFDMNKDEDVVRGKARQVLDLNCGERCREVKPWRTAR